jgi:pilus assembly protein CpaC
MLKSHFCALRASLALAACVLAMTGTLRAQQQLPARPVTFNVSSTSQKLEMTVNTSRILTLEQNVPRMLVNDPTVVRATPLSPNQVQVSALRPGATQVNVWDENEKIYTVDVLVTADVGDLERVLAAEFPEATLRLRPTNTSVIITGFVPRAEMVGSIVRIAEDYYPNIINRITVGGVQEVMLKVKVMEVSRTKLRRLGVNWTYFNGNDFITQTVGGIIAASSGQDAPTFTFGLVNNASAFNGYINALHKRDLIKVTAEPTLVTMSGRPASFNSGGEFPIIVPQSLGTVSIQYREFGTRVDFVPIVLGNGTIRLEVRPQISELDPTRSVTANGITVPGLRNRWVETGVEMRAGQTLAIAGLIYERVEAQNQGIPYLGDLPWVGAAFRAVKEENNEIESLIFVTPELVDALEPEEVPPYGPGSATESPCDKDLYWKGFIEVPKGFGVSCDGNNCHCGKCARRGQQCTTCETGAGTYEAIGPGVQVSRATGGAVTTAPQGRYQPQTSQMRNSRTPTPAKTANRPQSQPGLIGPVGYDVLK